MGKSSGASQRPVTDEERRLWDAQAEHLDSLKTIAEEQHGLALEDRAYYEDVFRDASTPEAQKAMADLQEQLTGTRPTEGDLTTDTLLRDVLVGSSGEMQAATKEFVAQQQKDFAEFEGELSGLSQEYVSKLDQIGTDYAAELAETKAALGTADADVLARETGAATAGISTAYEEARKGISSELARRGLAGTGVEASALGQAYQQEAMAKAGAMQQARMSAIGLSDQMRMQKLGIAGQQFQAQTGTAQAVYGQQAGVAGQLYGMGQQLGGQAYQLDVASRQQGIGNLQALSAAGQGMYVGSQNYLGQAAQSFTSGAQTAGQSAGTIGRLDMDWQMQQQKMQQQAGAGLGSSLMGIASLGTGATNSTLLGGWIAGLKKG